MKEFTSSNYIKMVRIGKYNWQKIISYDSSIYLNMNIGSLSDMISLTYSKGILSISKIRMSGSDVFLFACNIEDLEKYVDQLKAGHNIEIPPLYSDEPTKYDDLENLLNSLGVK